MFPFLRSPLAAFRFLRLFLHSQRHYLL
jgi:hypothetical protein